MHFAKRNTLRQSNGSQAIFMDPSDEILLANRSLCCALSDAEACVEKKRDWPQAHFRVGCACNILKNYSMAMDAFRKAFDLDPVNEEIEKAYRLQREYCQSS
ncbi:hypothetical protein ACS0TY_019883 [Phlomoides rotata]